MTARTAATLALLLMAVSLAGCWPFRKPKPVPPPAKLPAQTQPKQAPKPPAPPPKLESPPQIPPTAEAQSPVILQQTAPQPLPPPPPMKKRSPQPSPRVPPAAETPPPPAPAPQLVPMLTPAQRHELERSVTDRIYRAQNLLASISQRQLNAEQEEIVGQIRTFLKQAEEARSSDLLRANNLAERAHVLAEDLVRRLR